MCILADIVQRFKAATTSQALDMMSVALSVVVNDRSPNRHMYPPASPSVAEWKTVAIHVIPLNESALCLLPEVPGETRY
jgi:hypothetical protein